jgi:hypothetical protein
MVNASPSTSTSFARRVAPGISNATSSSVTAVSSPANGASFTGVTEIETSASSDSEPSEARKVKESGPS